MKRTSARLALALAGLGWLASPPTFADGLSRMKVSRKFGYIDDIGRFIWNPAN